MACCTLLGLLLANAPAAFRRLVWPRALAAALLLVELPTAYWLYQEHAAHLTAPWTARQFEVPLCSSTGEATIRLEIPTGQPKTSGW